MSEAHDDKPETEKKSQEKVKKERKSYRKVAIYAIPFLAIALAFWLIPGRHHVDVEPAASIGVNSSSAPRYMSNAMATCPAFSSTEVNHCRFSVVKAWAGMGSEKNLEPCIFPLPPDGHYTLWLTDTQMWVPGASADVHSLGFNSDSGEKEVAYTLRPHGTCPDKL